MNFCLLLLVVLVLWATFLFYRHQMLLKTRAHLMRETIRNHEFTFHLPTKGLFFGERALQETLNQLEQEINILVTQNEVESWQKLTRVLTHEIMNATTPIISISQSYLNSPRIQGTAYEEGIRAIYDTSRGLSTFIESYRKLAQLQQPKPTNIGLYDCIRSIQTLYAQLQWHINIPSSTTLYLDESMFRQVLINLLKNAEESGATHIDARWHNDQLWISNNGALIPADVAREIFIPFFTTKKSGSGIGLSLSRQLMAMQGRNLHLAETPVSGYHVSFVM